MARGPDGSLLADDAAGASLVGDDLAFATGLEKIIDRAMQRLAPGDRFVYGIHQELSPGIMAHLRARYRAAGWSDVVLRTGETGTCMLILHP
jgi:hypothetical protein